jgi:hypothetical protein
LNVGLTFTIKDTSKRKPETLTRLSAEAKMEYDTKTRESIILPASRGVICHSAMNECPSGVLFVRRRRSMTLIDTSKNSPVSDI